MGGVAMFGVFLIGLSVAGAFGICSVMHMKFNTASAQVLPFLLLGLGVDDMFLMIFNFTEVSLLAHIPLEVSRRTPRRSKSEFNLFSRCLKAE